MTRTERTFKVRVESPAGSGGALLVDLAEELQRRLRLLNILGLPVSCLLLGLAITTRRDAFAQAPMRTLFTQLTPLLQIANIVVGVSIIVLLAPRRRWTMRSLRVFEAYGIGIGLVAWIQNITADLRAVIADGSLSIAPVNTGAAHTMMLAAIVVAVAIFLPATRRYALARSLVMLSLAMVPPLLVLPGLESPVPGLDVYLFMYTVTLVTWGVIAAYGSYRIAVFREDASEARRLGQYVLHERIGEGGMGEVFRAEHQFLRRPCAVKLIRAEHAGDAATLTRFEREVQSTAALTHPSTVQIFDYGRADDGTFYYVMEYLDGRSLDKVVAEDGPLAPARAVGILRQLCAALGEAHERGLIHRDIKPGNVVVGTRGRVPDVAKLLDFGLVAPLRVRGANGDGIDPARLTHAGMIVGTPEYMSPEQCAGDDHVGVASDVYSLGALAYYLLTARPPFGGRGVVQVLAAHLHETPRAVHELRPDVSPALSAVIARALAKAPGDRYASADDFAAALTLALDDGQG
jgi:serine/threonine-protein kinase